MTLFLTAFAVIQSFIIIALGRRKKTETMCNIGVYFGYFFIKRFLTIGFTLGGLALVYHYKIFNFETNFSNLLFCVFLADFLYYWKHRLEHEIRVLWVAHSVHHSSSEFNLSTALRLPWLTPFYAWIAYAPLALLGFHPWMVVSASTIVLAYQFLIHTQCIGNLGILEYFLNTPSNHRVHHGSNKCYLDRNYGGILIIWDQIFKTYAKEKVKVKYGITHDIGTANPVFVNSVDVKNFIVDVLKSKSIKGALKVICGRP